MKFLLLKMMVLFVVLFFVSCGGSDSSDSSSCTVKSELVGTWVRTDYHGEEHSIIFKSDGTIQGLTDRSDDWGDWCVSGNIIHTEGTYTLPPEEETEGPESWEKIEDYTFAIDGDSFFLAPDVRTNGSDANGVWIASWKEVWPEHAENNEESGEIAIKVDGENIEYNLSQLDSTENGPLTSSRSMKGVVSWQESTFSVEVTEFVASYGEDEDDPSIGDTLYGCHWRGKDILELSFWNEEPLDCDEYKYVKQ